MCRKNGSTSRTTREWSGLLAAQAALAFPHTAHPQVIFRRAVETALRLPAKGVTTFQFGVQMDHRAGPVQALEQGFKLLDPQWPFVLQGPVAGAEVNHLGLVKALTRGLAAAEHLPPEKRPGLAAGQAGQHLAVGVAAQAPLIRPVRRPVADAAIDDGFGLHAGTPEKAGRPAPCCPEADGATAGSLLSQAAPDDHLCVPPQ